MVKKSCFSSAVLSGCCVGPVGKFVQVEIGYAIGIEANQVDGQANEIHKESAFDLKRKPGPVVCKIMYYIWTYVDVVCRYELRSSASPNK